MVRREDGYSVASLPYFDVVVPAPVDSAFDWTNLLSFIKDKTREKCRVVASKNQKLRTRRWYMRGFWDGSVNEHGSLESVTDEDIALLKKIAEDPSPPIKSYAKSVLNRLEQKKE